MQPKYPVFVPTKGRWDTRYTIRMFDKLGVPYTAFVESQEFEEYEKVVDTRNLHVLPHQNKGLVVTRNYIWDYAQSLGVEYFWTFDDNIRCIYRLHQNKRILMLDGTALRVIEDFAERYENLYISGMHYRMFAPSDQKRPPVNFNTRIYSNMLIRTNIPYRNEGFYNDDTDLCLRILKDGYCTAIFYVFLVDKQRTQTVKGGMTPHYEGDGRLRMAQELQRKHPDVTTITWKWGRWQHQVDYRPFKGNKLIRKPGVVIPDEPNEYGMVLTKNGVPVVNSGATVDNAA